MKLADFLNKVYRIYARDCAGQGLGEDWEGYLRYVAEYSQKAYNILISNKSLQQKVKETFEL